MPASALLLEELFEAGDERFLRELEAVADSSILKRIAARWVTDTRPFARHALLTYLDDVGADRPFHRPLIKLVLKSAEAKQDDEMLGALLVAFDGFAYRKLVTRWQWDPATQQSSQLQRLAPDGSLLARFARARRTNTNRNPRFTRATRRYLQRRAWRYFRKLAFRDGPRYRAAICRALARYQERQFQKPRDLLDAWGLMNALYRHAPALTFSSLGVDVRPGASLQTLAPAPFKKEVWNDAFESLLTLFLEAKSNTVRAWALAFLRAEHAPKLPAVSMETVKRLLRSDRADAQRLGAELLGKVEGLSTLPVSEWLELLALQNQEAVLHVVGLVKAHVRPDRLSLEQTVQLALAQVAPVAELGFGWVKSRPAPSTAQLGVVLPLARAGVKEVRRAAVSWLVELIVRDPSEQATLQVRDLLDSTFADVRHEAMKVLATQPRFRDGLTLWAAMAESPWPEVRETLVASLSGRMKDFEPKALHALWATSLLALARGGRAKAAVATQIAERVVRTPAEASALLPLLAIALRSIRTSERRLALAALTRAATQSADVSRALSSVIPELHLDAKEAWA